MKLDRLSRQVRESLPAPDGTPLGNLRHVVATFGDAPDGKLVIQATGGIYPVDHPGVVMRGTVADTGLTHGDLRALLAQLDSAPFRP